MKKLLNWLISICIIFSMIIPSGFSAGITNAKATNFPEITSTGMFRTTIQLEQAYDLTRLTKLDVVVLGQDGNQVDLLVTELQLESLSRLGFEPATTSDLGLLVDANQDTYHWLKTAIQGKIDQASVLVEENRLTNEATTKVNDLEVLSLIKSLSIEQLAGIQTLPGVDNDADGLTDTQESWWCTDPNNVDTDADGRSDYAEIQALKDWMANRRAVAPGETPWASWPFNPVTCPDKDFDSIPNLAERWELGLNMDLESTDRDKFDDGQEVFGVTYCPGGDFSCGYGDLPRSSDAGYVGQVMPSWVKAPGNHPFVAAFPLPTVAIEQSSIHIETVTVITTDHIISTGTEAIYSTAKTKGTNTSLSNTITWNEWQESYESTEEIEGINGIEITDPWQCLPWEEHCYYKEMLLFNADVSAMEKGCNITSENKSTSWGGGASVPIPPLFMITPHGEFSKESGQSSSLSDEYTGPKCRAAIKKFCDKHQGDFNDDWQNFCELANIKTDAPYNPIDSNFVDESTNMNVATDPNNYSGAVSNYQLSFNNIGETIANQLFELQFAITAKRVITGNTDGESHGGAQTTTTEQVDLTTTTNGESFSSEEAWGSAVAVDSSHAADFWFSYTVMNNGTDYAREISNLSFNIFIGDDPLSTYYISSDIGGEGILRNFQPGESHTYTSQRIPISLEQMKQIDLGSAISIIVEDISFGSDEYFYQNIINSNLQLSIDDGIDDNDEIINHYSISVFNGDLLLDVILRYFLFSTDIEGDLTALWTPEYIDVLPEWCNEAEIVGSGSTRSVWCKHQLTLGDWWNVYSNELENEDIPFQDRVAIPGSAVLIRFNKDSDLDGYSDLSEKRLETDPSDPKDFPQQELLAGIHSLQNGNNVTSTLSLLSTGLYDVYGVEAVMIAPDDSVSIVKNTVGGSGRVKAGQGVVAGSRIFTPEYSELTWTGSAFPVSAGYFTGVADLTYNFTVSCDNPGGCFVGQDDWSLNWITDVSSGTVEFSSSYQSPTPIDVDTNGLQIIFISGDVFDGNTFIIDAHSPRDTFQYTINYEPYTEPIVLVSYNDPQGNHRFVIPSNSMSLTSPSDNLVDFRGTMLNFNGVEILSLSEFSIGTNTNKFILDNPTEKPINDGQIFIEFIDLTGEVVSEILYTGDFLPGPNIIEITWSTSDFYPVYDPDRAYVILAYWTDYEGNILDTSGRPLSSFQVDPQPEFVITPADETWYFGTTSQGTILKREFSFANTGERTLLTYVDAPTGLLVSQTGSKLIAPADMATYEITLNTNDLTIGVFSDLINIHTSDPANPTRTISITGSITAGEASLPALINQLPLDYAVTVPGPQTVGNWYSFTHTLAPTPQSIHPVKVYSSDYSTLKGMGKYAYEFGTGTGGFNLFGDGRNGDLTVTTGQTLTLNSTRTNITASAGSTTATVTSSTNFAVGDLVLIHQTQGTSNVGKWEYNFIASISGTTWTLTRALTNTYSSSSGKAQVIKVPQYNDVTIQSGGIMNTPAWNGSTGGILVFVANGVVSIAGTVTANGAGYRRGDRGEYLDPVVSQGWQGESTVAGSVQSYNRNNGGGGGGQGDNDRECNVGIEFVGGAGGGGGSYGALGQNGVSVGDCISYGGTAGVTYGSTNLTTSAFLGSGGGGGGADGDEASRYGGYGGAGGGLILLSSPQINVTGMINSGGNIGTNGASGHNYHTGGGGGGSGGAILITTNSGSFGTSKVIATGGAGGEGYDWGGDGGDGGSGRIYIQYCGTITGTTNPSAVTNRIFCHIAEQLETSPYSTTRLQMPESFTTPKTYKIKYGRRLVFSASGNQTTTLRLPAGYLKSAELDILISNAGIGDLTISMDIGNNGSTDYTWTGTVNNLIARENIAFTTAYNNWWSAVSKQLTGNVDVPVKITFSKAGQVLLTDLKVSTYSSSLKYIQLLAGSYSDVKLSIKASGTTNPLSIGIDIGNNGNIDQLISVSAPSNPYYITSANLASQVNTYLSGLAGLVNVPVRLFLYNADQAVLTNFSASIIGTKDLGLSVSDITLPGSEPMETEIVPVAAAFHNNGNLPSGNFTVGFFASTPEVGEWYIGSALISSVLPGQSATAEILWNTSGFTGLTTVKVIADPFDHILETDEDNNQAVDDIYIRTRPDLAATAITPSDPEPKISELIQVTVNEKNFGETDAPLSTLALYDGNPDEGGILIGEQSAGLIGGSETSFLFDWQPLTTGWHRLYVKPDVTDAVDEFDEENNLTWQDIYIGLAGPIMLDSGTAYDPVYTPESGFGYIDINLPDQITTCGLGNLAEETIRRDPDGTVLYQFDHLLPGHFYHLDITLYECDGAGRQEYILVDDNQIAGPEDLGDGQVHRLSIRLDPAFYVDRSVTIAIQADGIDGAVVSEVNLHDIDYRYADAGGGADPSYPGDEFFGWLDGDAITTWGILPIQSVRVDQADAELRYQFDDLDSDKRYNLHFTFWQPSGTGRIQQIKVDGVDSGLTVNTGDYLMHQEKVSVPSYTYSTDGSIVVSIIRTNATVGAMVNEISLEEETMAAHVGCVAPETPYFSETYGSVLIEDLAAPIGSVIQALNPRGDTVGCFTVTSTGNYGFMRLYGEDTSETPIIPGMRDGEMVEYRVNGAPAVASPLFYWHDDHASHHVDLNAGNIIGQSILLNAGWNLISFNVEPPTPLVSSVLQSISGRYSRVLGEYGIHVPSLPPEFNTLNELHYSNGYYLRVTGTTSVSLLVEGIAQDCSTPKQLHAGWNWIGAPCVITETAAALQSITGFYQRVLSLDKTYDPNLPQYSTLLNLKPGEGYLIYITEPVTLTYPIGLMQDGQEFVMENPICSGLNPTPSSTLLYGKINYRGLPAPQGSLVEFITPRGEIAGCAVILDEGILPITQVYGAYGDDTGFIDGENIEVRVNGFNTSGQTGISWIDDKALSYVDVNLDIFTYFLPIMIK